MRGQARRRRRRRAAPARCESAGGAKCPGKSLKMPWAKCVRYQRIICQRRTNGTEEDAKRPRAGGAIAFAYNVARGKFVSGVRICD